MTVLTREQLIELLRRALQQVGNSSVLNDGVPEEELLGLELDTVFASEANIEQVLREIKTAATAAGARILLSADDIKAADTFADLLLTLIRQQVTS